MAITTEQELSLPWDKLFELMLEEYKDNPETLDYVKFTQHGYADIPEPRRTELTRQLVSDLYLYA